ncbi:unnamed protein product [Lactuca virosa]|uniref:Peptidase M20 dimerisation domain-containing protein n=1 Tax=Lactuca virosa TaxID=75947 RepID=A0AAU9MCF2_9ASTR|nr:unnamed protein product [Lactuca virosa]
MLDGGTGLNAIPDSVSITGTYRAVSKKSFYALAERIQEVIKAQAYVYRCSATVDFEGPNIQFKKFRKSISFFSASIKNNKKKIEEEEGTTWDFQEKTTEPPPLLRIVAAGSSLLLLRFVEPKGQPPPFCDRLATTENRHNLLLHSSSSVRTHQLRRQSDSSCRTPSNTNTIRFATFFGFLVEIVCSLVKKAWNEI